MPEFLINYNSFDVAHNFPTCPKPPFHSTRRLRTNPTLEMYMEESQNIN